MEKDYKIDIDELLNKNAKKYMIHFNLEMFKKTHSSLYKVIKKTVNDVVN